MLATYFFKDFVVQQLPAVKNSYIAYVRILYKWCFNLNAIVFISRWRTCVDAAKGSLANAVGALYVRKHFQEDAKKSALEMVHDIRAEFDQILEEIDWMDDLTKAR